MDESKRTIRPRQPGFALSAGAISALACMQQYRFLTIAQFAKVAKCSVYHAGETLRRLESRGFVGFFGFIALPGVGRTPKVYFLTRKGYELLLRESDLTDGELGLFVEAHQEVSWSPQMFHRLRLIDLIIALVVQVGEKPHLSLVQTFLEYRRVRGTHLRETTDYVAEPQTSENRIVPDAAFVLENVETGRIGLFLLEMDMGTERIAPVSSRDHRATVRGKFLAYDRYLTSGRFAKKYALRGFPKLYALVCHQCARAR